jgi:hypothetical protein
VSRKKEDVMTYKEKFVAVVKCGGRILREDRDVVRIPFGSEYEIYMKNLHTRKAVVDISVDGQDALDGNQMVLRPDETTTLKGFIKDSRVRNRFRFIKKTKEISDYRGDRIDDGIIRIRFRFEKDVPVVMPTITRTEDRGPRFSFGDCDWTYNDSGSTGGWSNNTTIYSCSTSRSLSSKSFVPKSDEGITVKGSETRQDFYYTDVGPLESRSEVIILRLVGMSSRGKRIRKPLTTKTKITCPTCGRRWKSTMKYCGNCSTYMR